MTLSALRWDTPNNVALSLTFLAEMVRRGEVRMTGSIAQHEFSETLTMEVSNGKRRG